MPLLAHTGSSSGGPNTEILLLGIGMLVLAGVFFFQKSASRRVSVVLLVVGAAAVTGAFTFASPSPDEHHDVALSVAAPEQGATVPAGTVTFEVDVEGAELAGESTSADAGHLHVVVDGTDAGMPSTAEVELELDEGEHQVEFEYVDSGHSPLDPPVTASVTVTAE